MELLLKSTLTQQLDSSTRTHKVAGRDGYMMSYYPIWQRTRDSFYIVGDSAGGWSDEFSFITQPPPVSNILVMVVGDIATTSNSKAVMAGSLKESYSLALIAGDLSYADGDNTTWDAYFNLIQPQAANSFWMSAIGNHEAAAKDYNGVPYLSRSILPNNELWYGFDYGPIHVLSFSTEHPTAPASAQYIFIEQDLQRAVANRANVPFIFTMAHKPIYTSNLAHGPELPVRANIEPLLVRYGVDIAIWGHNHCYERTYPMQYDKVNNTRTGSSSQPYNAVQAPIHVTVGSGGKELYTTWATKPAWSYYREAAYGYAKFSVSSSPRTLRWQWIKTSGQVPDEFYIQK